MLFDDGTHGMIPVKNVQAAIKDGGKVAQYMKFDDGTQGPVPFEKVHDAMKDGGQLIGSPPQLPQPHQTQQEIDQGLGGANAEKESELAAKSMQRALGASMFGGGPGLKMVESEALPSFKTLWDIARRTTADSEVAYSKISSVGWKKFSDTAIKGMADATESGDVVKAKAYQGAAMAAKLYSKYEAAWAWIGEKLPSAPIGFKLLLFGKLAKDGYDSLSKDDSEK